MKTRSAARKERKEEQEKTDYLLAKILQKNSTPTGNETPGREVKIISLLRNPVQTLAIIWKLLFKLLHKIVKFSRKHYILCPLFLILITTPRFIEGVH